MLVLVAKPFCIQGRSVRLFICSILVIGSICSLSICVESFCFSFSFVERKDGRTKDIHKLQSNYARNKNSQPYVAKHLAFQIKISFAGLVTRRGRLRHKTFFLQSLLKLPIVCGVNKISVIYFLDLFRPQKQLDIEFWVKGLMGIGPLFTLAPLLEVLMKTIFQCLILVCPPYVFYFLLEYLFLPVVDVIIC